MRAKPFDKEVYQFCTDVQRTDIALAVFANHFEGFRQAPRAICQNPRGYSIDAQANKHRA